MTGTDESAPLLPPADDSDCCTIMCCQPKEPEFPGAWSHTATQDYEPQDVWFNLFRWKGTTLPHLLSRHTFWSSWLIYFLTSLCKYDQLDSIGLPGCGSCLPELKVGDLAGTLLPLLTFFLAFYTAECYGRFKQLYTNLKRIEGFMRTIGLCVKNTFECPDEKLARWDMLELFRYLSASYYVLFIRLYVGEKHCFNMQSAFELGLLTKKEMQVLKGVPVNLAWFKLLSWSFAHVDQVSKRNRVSERDTMELKRFILGIRDEMNAVTYTVQMPVPLPYYHAITVLTVSICLVFSYAVAYDKNMSEDLSWFVLFLQLFGFLGMHEVAMQLADPFGDDDCDLPVESYVRNCMTYMRMFLEEESEENLAAWPKEFSKDGKYWACASETMKEGEIEELMKVAETLDKVTPNHQSHLREYLLIYIMRQFAPLYQFFSHWEKAVQLRKKESEYNKAMAKAKGKKGAASGAASL